MQALTENQVMSMVFPIIAGTAEIPSQENLCFGNLKDLADGSITKAKPDFYDGARPAVDNTLYNYTVSYHDYTIVTTYIYNRARRS